MVIEDLFVRLLMSCCHLPPMTGIPLSELENRSVSGIFPLFIRNLIISIPQPLITKFGQNQECGSSLIYLSFIYHSLCCVLSHSVASDSLLPHGQRSLAGYSPWGFSRQEYWSGLPCPPPGDLPNPGIKLRSPALQADSLPSKPPGKRTIL